MKNEEKNTGIDIANNCIKLIQNINKTILPQMIKLQETASKLVSSGILELVKNISMNFDDSLLQDTLKNVTHNMKKVGERTGKIGWTIPQTIPISGLMDIINNDYSNTEIDKYFYEFYTKNNEKELKVIIREIKSNTLFEKYKKIFNQAYFNYKRKKYFSAIIVLISVYEGMVCDISIEERKNEVHVIQEIHKMKSQIAERRYGMLVVDISSIQVFTESLFKNIPFNTITNKSRLNRGNIVHGNCKGDFKRIDALKMFNAIASLCHIAEEY